jgi:hypothetical protein
VIYEATASRLRKGQSTAFRLRNFTAKLFRGLYPKCDRVLSITERLGVRASMRHTARKLRNIGDERLVLVTPENDDFVLAFHDQRSSKWYFKMTVRTCFTWYGFAFEPSR